MVLTKFRINLATAFMLLISNAIMYLIESPAGIDRYVSLSIPIIAFGFLIIYKNRNIYLFYMIAGCLTTIWGTTDNPSGVILFFFAMYDNKSEKNLWLNFIVIVLSFCAKSYLIGYLTSDIFAVMTAFLFIFAHMYVRFWPIADIRDHKEVISKGFTIEQSDTIKALLMDFRHQESADKLRIGRKAYTARVGALRDRYNVTTDFMLALKLVEDGIININDLANAKTQQKKPQ